MTYQVGFLMEQNAGHLTNYRNLRATLEAHPHQELKAVWHELSYSRPGGRIERWGARLPHASAYVTGNARMVYEYRRALRHRHNAVFTNSWAAVFAAGQMRQIPTVIDFDSTPRQIDRMTAYGGPVDSEIVATAKHRLHVRAYQRARMLHAWSSWAKESVVREYGVPEERVVVNPPGVDLDFFRPEPGRRTARGEGRCRVLFVGGDFRRKGGHLLLEWLAHQPPDKVELHVVTREVVPAMPGLTVHSDVQANSLKLLQLYRSADVFVLPSLGECFGIATVEAMAVGLPVVTSDVGGTADIVEPGRNGFIVRSGDLDDLSTALGALVEDPARRHAMGSLSRQIASKRFDARHNALRTADLILGLLRP